MSKLILLIYDANINLLGTREPHAWGAPTPPLVESTAKEQAQALTASLGAFPSNHDGAITVRI